MNSYKIKQKLLERSHQPSVLINDYLAPNREDDEPPQPPNSVVWTPPESFEEDAVKLGPPKFVEMCGLNDPKYDFRHGTRNGKKSNINLSIFFDSIL